MMAQFGLFARRVVGSLLLVLAGAMIARPPLAMAADAAGTVFITGASRGIGLELAREYADRGWHVIATARRPADAAELVKLAATHPGVTLEQLDVTDLGRIDALAAKYRDQPIDVLINNAGIAGPVPAQMLGRMNYDTLREVLDTDAVGPMKLSEALLPNVLASRQKKIVTLSTSEASFAKLDAGRLYWYRAAKAAVNMLMLNLAYDVKKKGVAVALINPGPVDTDMMKGVPMKLQPPAEAVPKVIGIIDRLSVENSGRFWDYAGGEVPW